MFPKDEELPTWLHSALLAIVVAPFSGFLLFHGVRAIFRAHLPEIEGPDFGIYLVRAPLFGSRAVVAGIGLLFLSSSFLGLAYAYSRFSRDHWPGKVLPWVLLAIGLGMLVAVQ
ncbi:hypothetical protein [Arenimonas oryziterrae]|uniref:hypothetical protein n=1 Tax=Arenimonas oryziterrae TaxID=498055 RepID=UPI00047A1EC5|nr:hypothetical protein [Arenimonas oryziterrae]